MPCVSPSTAKERPPSPSVAVVKPLSQAPYRRQASVGLIMSQASPLDCTASPPLVLHGENYFVYNQQQQEQINLMENVKIREEAELSNDAKAMKQHIGDEADVHYDRPFDPNLVCPVCNLQFRVGEIQDYVKHYRSCQKQSKETIHQVDIWRQNV